MAVASLIVLIASLLWASVLLIFKCLGPTKVGFLSGRVIKPATMKYVNFSAVAQGDGINFDEMVSLHRNEDPNAPLILSNNIEAELQAKKREKSFSRKVKAIRVIFLFSGLGVLVAGALYYGVAVKSFNDSFDEVRVGTSVSALISGSKSYITSESEYLTVQIFSQSIREVTRKGLDISSSLLADDKSLNLVVDAIQLKIPEIEGLCSSKPFIGDTIEPIITDFKGSIEEIEKYSDLLRNSLSRANDAMYTIVNVTNNIDTGVDTSQKYFILCVWVSTFFFVVVVMMLVCCFLVTCDKVNCYTTTINTIGWPLFSLLLFLVWILASFFLATSLTGSDICIDPDKAVFAGLQYGLGESTDAVGHAVYINLVNYIMVITLLCCRV